MQVAQLSLLLFWNLHSYLNSFSGIANPSLLPLDDIVLKTRSSADVKCSDYWMWILSNQPGLPGGRKFVL